MINKFPKSDKLVDPTNAIYNLDRQLIVEHWDLVTELSNYISEFTDDRKLTLEYLADTQPNKYGFAQLIEFREYSKDDK